MPVPVIYLFYHRYFLVKPSYLYHLEYFLYGVVLALILLLSGPYVMRYLTFQDTVAMGFLSAALVEKAGAFICIAILTYRTPPLLMALNMVISAMLLGLGFATVENIAYALAIREPVIIVRLFSAVPVHVLTCGLIGYGLALMRLSGSWGIRARYILGALVLPFLFHGTYDTMLIRGGTSTYWIAPLIVVLIIGMEYLLAKTQTFPLLDGLKKHGVYLEEWDTIQRQPQYERWILRSMGSRNREHVPLFHVSLGRFRASVIIVLLAVAAASFAGRDAIMDALHHRLNIQEAVMLFSMLPALYALNLFFVGVVNPKYFQYSLIRIPIIIDADVSCAGPVVKTTTYHVTGANCYLKTVDPLERGTGISLVFACSDFLSPPVDGTVIWDSHDEQKQLSGTLVRLTGRPWGYRLFLIKYYLYRITRGLFFNLRLPGFQSIRRLFVRPVSVMQKEWRFSAGHRLFEQGGAGRVFYLIRKGEVDIVKTLDTGESVHMTTLREGDIFGEMAIVGNQPRLATAVCRTDCLLAVAEADNLDALIESNPVFTQRLIKNFANRLHDSEQIMLKSMAGMDDVSKRREKALITICRVLLLAGAGRDGRSDALKHADIDAIASRLDLDKKTIHDIIAALFEANDIPSLEKIVEKIL